jgi:hypothetical protein
VTATWKPATSAKHAPSRIGIRPNHEARRVCRPFPAMLAGVQDAAGKFMGVAVTWLPAGRYRQSASRTRVSGVPDDLLVGDIIVDGKPW